MIDKFFALYWCLWVSISEDVSPFARNILLDGVLFYPFFLFFFVLFFFFLITVITVP